MIQEGKQNDEKVLATILSDFNIYAVKPGVIEILRCSL